MNILSTIGCRAFQTVMKWAIPFLPYREPKILHSVQQVPALLQEQDISCVLLVTDRFLHNSGLIDPLKHTLTASGIRYVLYDETSSNPTVSNVETARTLYLSNGCQGLIGFGGGCVNDVIIHLATSNIGFGGVGESGMGAYHGKIGFDAFTHYKSIVDKKTRLDLPMRYQPYTKLNEKLIRMFLR